METSISALTYKGSITEAILEAKRQKKLFVVYISGDNSETTKLEETTWTDSKVVESVSKYCVLLHLRDGSSDAANFTIIYPQKSVPSIAAIGFNGVQVWQSEGFVSPEDLASNLEKAWFSLHIQDTLTAALASNKPDSSVSVPSPISTPEQVGNSSTVASLTSMEKHGQSSQDKEMAGSEMKEENNIEEQTVERVKNNLEDKENSGPTNISKSDDSEVGKSMSPVEEASGLHRPHLVNPENSATETVLADGKENPSAEEVDDNRGVSGRNLQAVDTESKGIVLDEKAECAQADTPATSIGTSTTSDVHLNIKLPNGVSLQEKFSLRSTLKVVKEYVDKNQASGIGSYDLAIPYPRRVFSDQDSSKFLSELGLFNRQALIVVPRQRAGIHDSRGSFSDRASSTSSSSLSSGSEDSYFTPIRRILSYLNPFSYLSGTSSSNSERAQTGMWEYGPNPDRPYSSYPSNPGSSSVGKNDGRSSKATTTRVGSNIHTLKHDEDDAPFGDQNPFWNGNSTQYGGSSDSNK